MLARVERFEGFADDEAKFFKALAKNQNREWFTKHKHEFEDGWNRPMLLLLAEARAAILAAMPRNIGAPERQARQSMPMDCYD